MCLSIYAMPMHGLTWWDAASAPSMNLLIDVSIYLCHADAWDDVVGCGKRSFHVFPADVGDGWNFTFFIVGKKRTELLRPSPFGQRSCLSVTFLTWLMFACLVIIVD